MKARKLHRLLGIALLLPFLGWVVTGSVFFLKPGYAGAYEILPVKTYPMTQPCAVHPGEGWLEIRCLRTVLGEHLLARTAQGWRQLSPSDGQPRQPPAGREIERLLADAFQGNAQRYGTIAHLSGFTARTTTGVEVTLDWDRMSLQQRGRDTDRIDLLYRIHYLQWTGIADVDRIFGGVGLAMVLVLTVLGARLAFRRRSKA